MILDEEVLKLAKQHLEWEVDENDETWIEYFATSQHIIAFAQKIYQMGYADGWCDGHKSGSTGLFGEPQ